MSTLSNGVVAIGTGSSHSCAVTSAGDGKCWGSNFYGQLGDGTRTDRLTPNRVRVGRVRQRDDPATLHPQKRARLHGPRPRSAISSRNASARSPARLFSTPY
ncbi:hypothetical protein K3F48_08240 [Methylosinus sp. Sm6]|nr:hypothetical protein [Methylosinus sp. Sm6]